MFQSFEQVTDPSKGAPRLARLRERLTAAGLDGFLVPRSDAHQSEYVAPSDEQLSWLTGFGGSAGQAIVLTDRAAVFVDGRYTLQVREQIDLDCFEPVPIADTSPGKWLTENAEEGAKIGYDPWLHTISGIERLEKAIAGQSIALIPVTENPLHAVWDDRPERPTGKVTLQPLERAGESAEDKISRIGEILAETKADTVILTQPDSIAWLLNIRGSDVAHNPVPLCFASLSTDGQVRLFIDDKKLDGETRPAIAEVAEIRPYDDLTAYVSGLAASNRPVLLDPDTCARAIADAIESAGGQYERGKDPVTKPKAVKNAAEIDGTRAAHLRDGAAMVRFLHWLDRTAPDGGVDEIGAAKALEAFRGETGDLKEISFDTISGAGPNGAVVHYRVTENTNRRLENGSLYLTDSGGQYVDGTTDITRTVAIGKPTQEMRELFTLVLKGHIAISIARFPAGTTGAQLDGLARNALWQAGFDYDHGTGHGVGVYLSVHEPPQTITKAAKVPFEAGMIISNEPGYYKTGEFGIRIENLELVYPAEPIEGGERDMLGFETLTYVPIDTRLVEVEMLSPIERAWLNEYHQAVLDRIGPLLDDDNALSWLVEATRPQ